MTTPDPRTVFLDAPEVGFALTAEDRAKVHPAIDADALERLLALVRPEHRGTVLWEFQEMGEGKIAIGPIFGSTGDPEIDALVYDLPKIKGKNRTGN